jgi:hypothetical protein
MATKAAGKAQGGGTGRFTQDEQRRRIWLYNSVSISSWDILTGGL